jgi:DNA-binding XRE family transcriptional regulator
VTATLDQNGNATHATTGSALLNFDVIKKRAAELLQTAPEKVTDGALGTLFGLSRETIWHYRNGAFMPRLETVTAMADILGLSVDEIRAGNPPPPRPSAPSTPKPPAAPKPKAGE